MCIDADLAEYVVDPGIFEVFFMIHEKKAARMRVTKLLFTAPGNFNLERGLLEIAVRESPPTDN